jgi:hypothetical protein
MPRFRSLFILFALAVLTFAGVALADWSYTTSFKHAAKTTLKVVEPDGFKVKVTIGSDVKEDTIPAVFQLPDGDAFVPVTVVAKDGSTWSQKIEVKDKQQTELKVQSPAGAKPAPGPAGPSRKFIGSASNTTNRCTNPNDRGDLRYDFLLDGTKVREVEVAVNRRIPNIEIAQGSYSVRVFKKRGSDYIFVTTSQLDVTKDGWEYSYGCK